MYVNHIDIPRFLTNCLDDNYSRSQTNQDINSSKQPACRALLWLRVQAHLSMAISGKATK